MLCCGAMRALLSRLCRHCTSTGVTGSLKQILVTLIVATRRIIELSCNHHHDYPDCSSRNMMCRTFMRLGFFRLTVPGIQTKELRGRHEASAVCSDCWDSKALSMSRPPRNRIPHLVTISKQLRSCTFDVLKQQVLKAAHGGLWSLPSCISTPNPKPETLNPKPQTLTPKP